jgi:hypothetical protein
VTATDRGPRPAAALICVTLLFAAVANASACGDVHADLIMGPDAANVDACASSSECSASSPVCDSSTNVCSRCRTDDDCLVFAPQRLCDTTSGSCVECKVAADCRTRGELQRCSESRCVECVLQSDCEVDEFCDSVGSCEVRCDAVTPCVLGEEPHCDLTKGICVQCRSSADCSGRSCENSECVN